MRLTVATVMVLARFAAFVGQTFKVHANLGTFRTFLLQMILSRVSTRKSCINAPEVRRVCAGKRENVRESHRLVRGPDCTKATENPSSSSLRRNTSRKSPTSKKYLPRVSISSDEMKWSNNYREVALVSKPDTTEVRLNCDHLFGQNEAV